jgi:hypothetical protein
MEFQFSKHYTREEARALLPEIRQWLGQLSDARASLDECEEQIGHLLRSGADAGGAVVHQRVKCLVRIKDIFQEFQSREIQVKDLDRGLIDFPAIMGGQEVFLCWEKDEDDIEYWHDLKSGYAGRQQLD